MEKIVFLKMLFFSPSDFGIVTCEDRTRAYVINEHLSIKLNFIHKDDTKVKKIIRMPRQELVNIA
jgi:hypothetical protein